MILPTAYQEERELHYLHELEHNLINALIITSHSLPVAEIRKYSRFGSIVFCEEITDPLISCVTNNRLMILKQLFRQLKSKGKTKIGLLFVRRPELSKTTREALTAYQQVFHQQQNPALVIYDCHSSADGCAAYSKLINAIPDIQVIISESDTTATGVYQASLEHQPQPIVIGQGNQLASQILNFTSIDQHLEQMGKAAVELALHQKNSNREQIKFNILWR